MTPMALNSEQRYEQLKDRRDMRRALIHRIDSAGWAPRSDAKIRKTEAQIAIVEAQIKALTND